MAAYPECPLIIVQILSLGIEPATSIYIYVTVGDGQIVLLSQVLLYHISLALHIYTSHKLLAANSTRTSLAQQNTYIKCLVHVHTHCTVQYNNIHVQTCMYMYIVCA